MFGEPEHFTLPPIDHHDFTGDTLGRYHLDRRVGYGGVASIYAATCKNTGAIFALKVLHPEHDSNPIAVQRFRQEAQLGAQIRHPNLIPVYDHSWLGGRHFIAMELVEGKTLTEELARGPIPWERSTAIACQLLAGLVALHERGVAHRDVSPNNCMLEEVDGRERARLFDLSHARVVERADGLVLGLAPESVPMLIYGTPHFIAPERLRGSRGDFRSDIFEVGALWYTALTGAALPDPLGADPVSVAQRLDLPPILHAVLLGALEIHTRRHHSAASMLGTIQKALEDIRGRRQRMRRLKTFAPLLSLLAIPVWFAARNEPTCQAPPAIPKPASQGAEAPSVIEARSIVGPIGIEASGIVAPAGVKALGIEAPSGVEPEPIPLPTPEPTSVWLAGEPVQTEPPRRERAVSNSPFNLRRALAKCKPHPTARIEITISPGERVQIDGERPTGELGRCVEDVLTAHPPHQAETIKL
ncbi:Protein kinase domain-containing protein [Nannocystis exedens]|uniref:Protein kinase domain-containing protein n=1 Tax=Nannocystis exedens TaxID=54 RepID=A0A1I1XXD6_9BACT|nr:serine/threonine-protein kinase [Nannocystis exedens]PCC73233.1 serine/threonine protein kinase [Nannocystis exedens]SFE10160.1 Protein kinase domain-containing protein [Nannocystis exedens]